MAKKISVKSNDAMLRRLQAKGVTVEKVKPAERPVPISDPPKKTAKKKVAAPKKKQQTATSKKKQWEMDIIRNDFTDYIDKVIIKEI